MNILLINNHTQHLADLNRALLGHKVEVQMYKPGLKFHDQGKDLVILSGGGGEGLEIDDKNRRGKLWYEDEMNFVLSTKTPVLGICMGFEVICRAYGAEVPKMPKLLQGFYQINATTYGRQSLNRSHFRQYEAHQWHVPKLSAKHFEVLADSPTGVEIIRHRNRRLTATQFHPEKGGTLTLPSLLAYA